MKIVLILFCISLSLVFFLLLFGLFKKKVEPQDQIRQRIRGIEEMKTDNEQNKTPWADKVMAGETRAPRKKSDISFHYRVVVPARYWANKQLHKLAPKEIYQWLAAEIAVAGKTGKWTPDNFMLVVAVMPLIMGGVMLMAVMSSHISMVQKITFCTLGAFIGAMLPFSTLNRTIKNRQDEIRRQLPETFDLLCVSVEAGLSFDAAMKKITERMSGAFNDECKHMLSDVRMGMTRRDALKGLGDRCRVQEVSLFVTSVIQAERLGTNMANTLRIQADNVRERHRQWVKGMALKAPVKIVLPLVGCILPAIFIVALGPAVMNIMKSFVGK